MPPKIEVPSLNFRELVGLRRSINVSHGLNELSSFIDFEAFRPKLEELCQYGKMGRPHFDEVKMFKVLVLQTFYNLSDEEMEFQLSDRLSFQRFVGIGYADDIPDARTIWKFRERLGDEGTKELFDAFYAHMKSKGLKSSKGKLIDATFQEARAQRNTPEEYAYIKEHGKAPANWSAKKKAHKDVEATQTKKGGETHRGYKGHVLCDEGSKIIENYITTTASVHDSQVSAELLPGENQGHKIEVLADSGYFGKNVRKALHKKGAKPRIMQRRVKGQKVLTKTQQCRNRAISRRRCRIEHIFGAIKQFGGDVFRGVSLRRCKIRQGFVFLLYNMKRFCFLHRTGQLCPEI